MNHKREKCKEIHTQKYYCVSKEYPKQRDLSSSLRKQIFFKRQGRTDFSAIEAEARVRSMCSQKIAANFIPSETGISRIRSRYLFGFKTIEEDVSLAVDPQQKRYSKGCNLGRGKKKKAIPDGLSEMQEEIKSEDSGKYVNKSEQILAVYENINDNDILYIQGR